MRIALFVFILVSVSSVQAYFGILRALRLGLLSFAICFAFLLLFPQKANWRYLTATWPSKAVLLLAGIACLSAPFGLSMGASGSFFLDVYGRNLLFFFMLIVSLRSVWDLRFFTWAFVASAGVLGILSFTVMEFRTYYGGEVRLDSNQMYDANDLGMIFMVCIPLGILLFQSSRGLLRLIAGSLTVIMVMATALTGSRGAFIGFAVVIPALFFTMKHVSFMKRTAAVLGLILALAVGAPDGYWDRITTIFSPSEDYNLTESSGRVELAKRGLHYMRERPLFGVGLANFPRAEGTISPLLKSGFFGERALWLAPHNTYVQVGAELGAVAFGIWISLILAGTVGLARLRKRFHSARHPIDPQTDAGFLNLASSYLPVSFLAFASTSFFVSHAYTPIFYIQCALLSGVLLYFPRYFGSPHRMPPPRPLRSAAAMARPSRSASFSQ